MSAVKENVERQLRSGVYRVSRKSRKRNSRGTSKLSRSRSGFFSEPRMSLCILPFEASHSSLDIFERPLLLYVWQHALKKLVPWSLRYLEIAPNDSPCFVNNTLHFWFSECGVTAKDIKFCSANGLFAQKIFIETEFSHNKESKETWFWCQGFYKKASLLLLFLLSELRNCFACDKHLINGVNLRIFFFSGIVPVTVWFAMMKLKSKRLKLPKRNIFFCAKWLSVTTYYLQLGPLSPKLRLFINIPKFYQKNFPHVHRKLKLWAWKHIEPWTYSKFYCCNDYQ